MVLQLALASALLFAAGNKPVESWGGKTEGSVAASRHSSWDEEEDSGGGVWNSTGSQGNSSSFNSGGWGHAHGGKRGNIKVRSSFVLASDAFVPVCTSTYLGKPRHCLVLEWRWRQLDEPCFTPVFKHGPFGKNDSVVCCTGTF